MFKQYIKEWESFSLSTLLGGNMKIFRILISITIPIFLIMLFASLLTTNAYLMVSKGLYDSHDSITYDHDYASERIMGYLNYRYDDLYFGENEEVTDETCITRGLVIRNTSDITDGLCMMRDLEISHMVDVKNLYTTLRIVAFSSLIIGVSLSVYMYKRNKKELYKTFNTMHYVPILFIMVVGGYMIVDFNKAFTIFHQLFFTNDDWLLYSNDVLIQLLPQNFWLVSGSIILLLFSAALGLIHYLNEKYLKNA